MASTPGPWVAAGESSTLPVRLLRHPGTRVPWATSKPSRWHRVSPPPPSHPCLQAASTLASPSTPSVAVLQQRQCPRGTLAATTKWQQHWQRCWWQRWHWQPGAWLWLLAPCARHWCRHREHSASWYRHVAAYKYPCTSPDLGFDPVQLWRCDCGVSCPLRCLHFSMSLAVLLCI